MHTSNEEMWKDVYQPSKLYGLIYLDVRFMKSQCRKHVVIQVRAVVSLQKEPVTCKQCKNAFNFIHANLSKCTKLYISVKLPFLFLYYPQWSWKSANAILWRPKCPNLLLQNLAIVIMQLRRQVFWDRLELMN